MRKRSNRADAKVKADLQRWLIESGEAEELVAFLREERARHPAPPPRVVVTTSLDVDIFDAMIARAASEGITSRSGALRAAVREWVSDVECLPEAHQN
ncbi:CopG family transcriptional regulator [Actinomyces sp.]